MYLWKYFLLFTLIVETREIISRLFADELNGQPIQFVDAMYDTTSDEFRFYADLIEPEVSTYINMFSS